MILITEMTWSDESEGIPEIVMPTWGALLTEDGDLILFPLSFMTLKLHGYEYEVEVEEVKIPDFYTPSKKANFLVRWILPPLLCTSAGLFGTATAKADKGWQYALSGGIGFGLGITLSILVNGGYK